MRKLQVKKANSVNDLLVQSDINTVINDLEKGKMDIRSILVIYTDSDGNLMVRANRDYYISDMVLDLEKTKLNLLLPCAGEQVQIYTLTPIGNSLASSTHPVGDARSMMRWKIIYLIRRLHKASKEQILEMTGLPSGEVSNALVTLENKGVVQDITKG